jgi:regulator of nucleoside diphosphate kinase
MNGKNIVVTDSDFGRLQWLIESSRNLRQRDADHLDALERELEQAIIVKANEVPGNVVTMNSRVRVRDLDTRREVVYKIVFPREANAEKNLISVLAPIGTALLGYRAGSTVEWQVPSGLRRLQILAVEYQPETAKAAA